MKQGIVGYHRDELEDWVAEEKLQQSKYHIVWPIAGEHGANAMDILLLKKMHKFFMKN